MKNALGATLAALVVGVVVSGCAAETNEEGAVTSHSALINDDQIREAAFELVSATYRFCLGREPDTSGHAIWGFQVWRRDIAPEQLQNAICDSDEGRLANLYFSLLARDPDEDGMRYWCGEQLKGMSLASIATAFQANPEFAAVTPAAKDVFAAIRQARKLEAAQRQAKLQTLFRDGK